MYKAEDYHEAIEFIHAGEVIADPLISRHFSFDDYQEVY